MHTHSSTCWQGGQQGLLQGTKWQFLSWEKIQFKQSSSPNERGRNSPARPCLFHVGDIIKRWKGIRLVIKKKLQVSLHRNRLRQHGVGKGLTGLDIASLQSWNPFSSDVACFELLTVQEHSVSLGLSLFSHKPTPPSPTWSQKAHSAPSTAEMLQEILSKFASPTRWSWVCL